MKTVTEEGSLNKIPTWKGLNKYFMLKMFACLLQ
jgi:hypothetical protein